jgi:hypothetical protein
MLGVLLYHILAAIVTNIGHAHGLLPLDVCPNTVPPLCT